MQGWLIYLLNLLGMGAGSPTVAPPVADFVGTPTSGLIPLSVQFTDLSTNSPTAWAWTATGQAHGTVYTSTQQNPLIVFGVADTYNVSLTATNGGGSGSTTKVRYITASAPNPWTVYWTWSVEPAVQWGWEVPSPVEWTWSNS